MGSRFYQISGQNFLKLVVSFNQQTFSGIEPISCGYQVNSNGEIVDLLNNLVASSQPNIHPIVTKIPCNPYFLQPVSITSTELDSFSKALSFTAFYVSTSSTNFQGSFNRSYSMFASFGVSVLGLDGIPLVTGDLDAIFA